MACAWPFPTIRWGVLPWETDEILDFRGCFTYVWTRGATQAALGSARPRPAVRSTSGRGLSSPQNVLLAVVTATRLSTLVVNRLRSP